MVVGVLLYGCQGVVMLLLRCSNWLLVCCYVVTRVFWMVVRLLCGFQGILMLLGGCLEFSVLLLWCLGWLSVYNMVSMVFSVVTWWLLQVFCVIVRVF